MRPISAGTSYDATPADLLAFDAIGWDVATAVQRPTAMAVLLAGLGVIGLRAAAREGFDGLMADGPGRPALGPEDRQPFRYSPSGKHPSAGDPARRRGGQDVAIDAGVEGRRRCHDLVEQVRRNAARA